MRRLLIALLALAVTPATAAAGAWSPPRTIARGIPAVSEPTIAFGASGRALVSARLSTEADGSQSHGFSRLLGQAADGTFSGRGRVTLAAAPALYGQSRVALLRLPLADGDRTIADLDDPVGSLGFSFGTIAEPTDSLRRLTRQADRSSGAIAADPAGEVAAAWIERNGPNEHLVVARRRPGASSFGRPAVVRGSGNLSAATLAYGANGDLVLAYQRSMSPRGAGAIRRVEARVRRAGHGWGAVQVLGASSGFSVIAAAVSRHGRAVVAWGTQDGGEQADTPWIVRAALLPAGPHRFRAAQELDRSEGVERPAGRVAVAMTPSGQATVAWSSIAGTTRPSTFPVRVATAGGSLRFAAPEGLAADAALGDVAAGPDETVAVVWATLARTGDHQTTEQAFAAVRPPGAGAFAAAEAVSPVEGAALPRVAFDPVTGRPAAVWVGHPATGASRLRFAIRSPA